MKSSCSIRSAFCQNSPVPVLATIAAKGGGLIAQVKARPDVEIATVTAANRDRLPNELAHRFLPR